MRLSLACLLAMALTAAAQDYRWIGTNLYDFAGCRGNTNYLVIGRVETFYAHGIGKYKCPIAQVIVRTNYGFRLDPQPRLYRGHEQENARDVLEAMRLVESGRMNSSYYYGMLDPMVARHIEPTITNIYAVVLNATATKPGRSLAVYAAPNGLQPWHKTDGTPVALATFDCGRPFKPKEETLPAITYTFTKKGLRKLTNAVPVKPTPDLPQPTDGAIR